MFDKFPAGPPPSSGPVSPVQNVCTLKDYPDGAAALNELDTAVSEQESRLKELIILWNAPNYRVACDAIRGDAFDSALAEEANKLLSDAVARDKKVNKRKSDSAGWGGGASRRNARLGDGWGPRNSQAGGDWGGAGEPASGGGWGSGGSGKGGNDEKGRTNNRGGWGVNGSNRQDGPPPASFGGDSAPWSRNFSANRSPLARDECAYCHKKGHYKNACPWLNGSRNPSREW